LALVEECLEIVPLGLVIGSLELDAFDAGD
jgi:hypothetical protein